MRLERVSTESYLDVDDRPRGESAGSAGKRGLSHTNVPALREKDAQEE